MCLDVFVCARVWLPQSACIRVNSRSLPVGVWRSRRQLKLWIGSLLWEDDSVDVFRCKGVVNVAGSDMKFVLQVRVWVLRRVFLARRASHTHCCCTCSVLWTCLMFNRALRSGSRLPPASPRYLHCVGPWLLELEVAASPWCL